jgi:hypothetical protein
MRAYIYIYIYHVHVLYYAYQVHVNFIHINSTYIIYIKSYTKSHSTKSNMTKEMSWSILRGLLPSSLDILRAFTLFRLLPDLLILPFSIDILKVLGCPF